VTALPVALAPLCHNAILIDFCKPKLSKLTPSTVANSHLPDDMLGLCHQTSPNDLLLILQPPRGAAALCLPTKSH